MRAVADADHEPLERWAGMREAEIAVVVGRPPRRLAGRACSASSRRPLSRFGAVPADGPEQWSVGHAVPAASKKVARAINAASGRRPLVVLANLAGFDGSPESMRRLQLEYGAEIGRAIVNFDGPIAFCVISRFHGGAFVVFSRALNDNLETIAIEGAFASVIGGAPAAAVVFARDVDNRTREDERIAALDEQIGDGRGRRPPAAAGAARRASGPRCARRSSASWRRSSTRSTASQRAVEVGSVDRVDPRLRAARRPDRRDRARDGARRGGRPRARDHVEGAKLRWVGRVCGQPRPRRVLS